MKRLTKIVLALSILILAVPLQGTAFDNSLGGDSRAQSAESTNQANSPTELSNPADEIVHGVYLPPINHYGTEILAFNDMAGKDIGLINYFVGFYQSSWTWLPSQIAAQMSEARRPEIMITWVPKGRNCRTMEPDQPGDWSVNPSLYDIVDGYCDDYIRHMAQQLKDLPFTFLLRFGHEMNITAATWWVGHYNNDPQLFIDAYRRVYQVFESEGVKNVQWVWSPSYSSSPREEWNSLFNYYPGDEYVDWIGIVVFNQGEWLGVPWWSLTELLDSDTWDHVLPEVMCRYAKPIILDLGTVDGSRPGDGTKEGWLQDGYQALDQYPFVKAVVWFNDWDDHSTSKADFRVVGGSSLDPDPWHEGYAYPLPEGDGRWTEGYRAAIARDKFISYVPPLEEITPRTTWCGGEPLLNIPGILFAEPGETKTYALRAVGLEEDVDVALSGLPPGVTAQLSQSYLLKPQDELEVQITVSPNRSLGRISYDLSITSSMYDIQLEGVVIVTDKIHRAFLPAVRKHP